jgi:hypothetical protein
MEETGIDGARQTVDETSQRLDSLAASTRSAENELYVFTHAGAECRTVLKERFDAILRAMDKAAARQGV